MAAYTPITWTAGDTITEAKLDAMVANDQSEDAHAANGYIANNNIYIRAKDAGGTVRNIMGLDASDDLQIGDNTHVDNIYIKTVGGFLSGDNDAIPLGGTGARWRNLVMLTTNAAPGTADGVLYLYESGATREIRVRMSGAWYKATLSAV